MNKFAIALVTAAIAAAPALSAQATTATPAPTARAQHMGPGHRGDHFAKLNLTDAQKAQVKAIHEKYAAQFKSAREAAKPNMDAMRAARQKGDTATLNALRAKMRSDMAPMEKVRAQEMAEIRAILTPDQQKQFDTMAAQQKQRMQHGAWKGHRGGQPRPGPVTR